MNVNKYLDLVAYVKKCDLDGIPSEDVPNAYYSKFDDSYITFVGLEDDMEYLASKEITEFLTHGVGFSPKENKWYGWSHRGICGFTIGSTCKKGDCHYVGSNIKEQKNDAIMFWEDDNKLNVRCEGIIEHNDKKYFNIKWDYDDKVTNEKLRNTISGVEHFIAPLGKGEWTSTTMDDARQMATDYNKGVS